MSGQRQAVLYLGSGRAVLGCFSAADGKPVLESVVEAPLLSFMAGVEAFAKAVGNALPKLPKNSGRKPPVTVICPSMPLFTKCIDIPSVGSAREDAVLQYEAARAIPHPLDRLAWDYAWLSCDGVERRVALAAVRYEWPELLGAVLSRAGLEVRAFAGLPSCLVHAARGFGRGDRLLLYAGAQSALVLFIGENDLFWRSLPFGSEAATADSDVLGRRLNAEIRRALAAWQQRNPAFSPAEMLLAGPPASGELSASLDELSQRLNLRVERLRAQSIGTTPDPPDATDSELRAILHGAAVEALGLSPLCFDLRTQSFRERQDTRKRLPALSLAAGLSLLAAGVFYTDQLAQREHLRTHSVVLEAAAAPILALESQVIEIAAANDTLAEELEWLSALTARRSTWTRFLADLQQQLAEIEDVWIDSLQIRAHETAPAAGSNALKDETHGLRSEQPPFALYLTGRMLDRANPLSHVSPEMRKGVGALIDSFVQSDFIARIGERQFDTSQPGLLRFEFTLVMEPEQL